MEFYDSLKPNFVLDSLLLPNFTYCCRPEDYHCLFQVIEPSIALSRIGYLIESDCVDTDKVQFIIFVVYFNFFLFNR